MRCWNCRREVPNNDAFSEIEPEEYDQVVDWFDLIHIDGRSDQFDKEGVVVICQDCINLALY